MKVERRTVGIALVWTLVMSLGVVTGAAVHRLWDLRAEVERLADQLTLDTGPESTLIYDSNNNLVSALFEEHRIGVRLEEMSPHLVNAVLVTEDKRFYDHDGIDPRRIVMAAIANQRAGEIVQGGSTITQQLVRGILLNREKNYTRKLKEALLAIRLEERYSKQEILQAYLNRVYFGDGFYGIEAAARGYFGKTAAELDAVESAMLAGLIKGPSLYSPTKAPELARKRRDLVLALMRQEGVLRDDEYRTAVALPVKALLARDDHTTAVDLHHTRGSEYFRDAVARELIQRFGAEAVYTGGLRVYTTLDRRLQQIAEDTMAARLSRSPRPGRTPLQGALVAIEPKTGYVKALVGGRDFRESPFNRALDAKRQPGSAFKPFIWAMALESGYAPSTTLDRLDEPIETPEGPWLPAGEHETSSARLRDALVLSSNRAAAHLLRDVGIHRTVDLVHRFGIASDMPRVPSLALGTGEVSLFELTAAYTVFANRGTFRQPTMIRKVLDRYGREIYRAPNVERAVISEATAFLMTSMMADVINRGTAHTARTSGFKLAAAGKTGTSQSYADAWFVGYTPQLVTGVWFGHDQPQTIMNRGYASVVAVPAWAKFMAGAHKDMKSEWFEMPGSLTKVKLCRLSGQLATDRCHLPVIEPPRYDLEDPLMPVASTVREGGVFEELRHVSRMPEPCSLPHSDELHRVADFEHDFITAGESPDLGVVTRAPAVVPASLRPQGPSPVMTLDPGAAAPRPASVAPVSSLSAPAGAVTRPPGN
jgi:1A family penicillin-binding protein